MSVLVISLSYSYEIIEGSGIRRAILKTLRIMRQPGSSDEIREQFHNKLISDFKILHTASFIYRIIYI